MTGGDGGAQNLSPRSALSKERLRRDTVGDRNRRHRLALATALGISPETLAVMGAEDEAQRRASEAA
jgi:hypothetical protein